MRWLIEKRQHHEGVGLEAGPSAHLLGLRQVNLRQGRVPGIEMERSETVVAREEELRLSDLTPPDGLTGPETYVHADLRDFDAVQKAVDGVDAVMHLGAIPNEAPFEDIAGRFRGGKGVATGRKNAGDGRTGGETSTALASGADAGGPSEA